MKLERVFRMKFSSVYPHYVTKATKKQRKREVDFRTYFSEAPKMHPSTALITGVVCGVRVENVEDPLMRNIRYLDKLVDELAKGKAMEKILREA